jgi:hypothetical protein
MIFPPWPPKFFLLFFRVPLKDQVNLPKDLSSESGQSFPELWEVPPEPFPGSQEL